jgi:hypothetical protein
MNQENKYINPFYNTQKLYNNNVKFNNEFISPIQKIKKIMGDGPNTVITLKQIEEFVKNPQPIETNSNKIKKSDISVNEAISRICDFD